MTKKGLEQRCMYMIMTLSDSSYMSVITFSMILMKAVICGVKPKNTMMVQTTLRQEQKQ